MYDVYYTFVRFKTKDARSLRLALCSTSSLIVFFSYYYFSSGDTDDFNHNVKKKKKKHIAYTRAILFMIILTSRSIKSRPHDYATNSQIYASITRTDNSSE